MASSVIHMCVAKEINKYLKRDDKNILIGTIAPDISKLLNETKEKSHFLNILLQLREVLLFLVSLKPP